MKEFSKNHMMEYYIGEEIVLPLNSEGLQKAKIYV
jgi:hypothetical protein